MSYALSDEIIEKIKEDNDIVDVISDYIELSKAGANYKACCPFHSEKTPSFIVSPTKQIYNCFGCGEGGDVISFVSKYLNIDFVESAKILADRAGIELRQTGGQKRPQNDNKVLYQINREAAIYYYSQLRYNQKAMKYLSKRDIDENLIKTFGIGYAPDSWDDLRKYLNLKGYDDQLLLKAGLIIERNSGNGYYNRFRNRIIFPIMNNKNKIIGFGGRVLDDSVPKYLNSPDTPIYNKRENLYGANNLVKFHHQDKIFLTEGYMDTITLFKFGFGNAVASLGTAFTEQQAKLIKKYKKDLYICYDADIAGQKAINAAFEVLNKVGMHAKAVIFEGAKDPDEYLRKYGVKMFNELLQNSLGYVDFKMHLLKKQYNIKDPEGKIQFAQAMMKFLSTIHSSVKKDVYIKKIAKETGISPKAISNDFKGGSYSSKDKYIKNQYRYNNKDRIVPVKSMLQSGYMIADNNLLHMIVTDKYVYDMVKDKITPDDFLEQSSRDIAKKVFEAYEDSDKIDFSELKENLDRLQSEKLSEVIGLEILIDYENKEKAVNDYIKTIKIQKLKQLKNKVKIDIKAIEHKDSKTDDDLQKLKKLLRELIEIQEKIRLQDKFH